jgi:Sec-independent protein secretion pathway component TatC
MILIEKLGVLDLETIRKQRGLVWFAMLLGSAVVTPPGSPKLRPWRYQH